MPKKRKRPATFTAVQAVKANARERLGTPPPEKVLPDTKAKARRDPKHKETLSDLLQKAKQED